MSNCIELYLPNTVTKALTVDPEKNTGQKTGVILKREQLR
uniref:Uncharacterized protein n=1 Tax=Anguilla anguilla TaxID=7936 RepID=A0A0E9PIU6_ANGAN